MKYCESDNKRTGRTTRMLEEARRQVDAGKNVIIIGMTNQHMNILRDQYQTLYGKDAVSAIGWLSWPMLQESRQQELVYGVADKDPIKVLVDHSVIESYFRGALEHLHAFDLTAEQALDNWLK